MIDLGLIHIDRLIVHEIPRRYVRAERSNNELILSEVARPLEDNVRNFFQERLVSTLSGAYDVELDPSASSLVPLIAEALLAPQ